MWVGCALWLQQSCMDSKGFGELYLFIIFRKVVSRLCIASHDKLSKYVNANASIKAERSKVSLSNKSNRDDLKKGTNMSRERERKVSCTWFFPALGYCCLSSFGLCDRSCVCEKRICMGVTEFVFLKKSLS